MANNDGTLVIEGARIGFRNFTGRETVYNAEGDRNFAVFLDEETAQKMIDDGWNVKTTKDREVDGEEIPGEPYLQVSVKYRGRNGADVRAPHMVLIGETSRKQTELDEDTCALLDDVDIVDADLIVRPYHWEMKDGKSGVKAYCKTLYLTHKEDYLELKYAQMSGGSDE